MASTWRVPCVLLVVGLAASLPGTDAATVTRPYDVASGVDPGVHFGYHVCGEYAPILDDGTCGDALDPVHDDGFRLGLVGLRSPEGDSHREAMLVVVDDNFDSPYVLACVAPAGTGTDPVRCPAGALQAGGCSTAQIALPAGEEGGFGGDDRPLVGFVHLMRLEADTLHTCFASTGLGTAVYL